MEDIPSAIILNRTHQTLALLGSSIPLKSLAFLCGKCVIFALDEDATKQSIKLLQKYGAFFNKSAIISLQKDIKNMTLLELSSLNQTIYQTKQLSYLHTPPIPPPIPIAG